MLRLGIVFLSVLAGGCVLPSERQAAVKPLPEDAPPLTYAEAASRARLQATAAVEAFYVDRWADLEDAAKALEQTARLLPRCTEVPARHRDTLAIHAGDLGKEALKLQEVSRTRDVRQTNEVLQRINLKVRELRPDN